MRLEIDFQDYDVAENGFDDELAAMYRPACTAPYPFIHPEVLDECERENSFKNLLWDLSKEGDIERDKGRLRSAITNLTFDIAKELDLINKFGRWQTKEAALLEVKERVKGLWLLTAAWIIDSFDIYSVEEVEEEEYWRLAEVASTHPEDYKNFWGVMMNKGIILPIRYI